MNLFSNRPKKTLITMLIGTGGLWEGGLWKLKNNIQEDKPTQTITLDRQIAPSVLAKELPDEFASEVGAAPATTLSQFQIFSLFLVICPIANANTTHIIKSILFALVK